MRSAHVILAAVSGIASAAAAQSFSLTLVPSVMTLDTIGGGFFTIDVYADADVGTHIDECAFGLQSNSFGVTDMVWTPAEWAAYSFDDGYAGNGNYNSVNFGQVIIPGIVPPADNSYLGQRVGSFVVSTIEFYGVLDFDLVERATYSLRVYDDASGSFYSNTSTNLSLYGFSINAVAPAPSGAVAIVMCGLMCSRRRR